MEANGRLLGGLQLSLQSTPPGLRPVQTFLEALVALAPPQARVWARRRCGPAQQSHSSASSAGDMQLPPLPQGPRHPMPAGAREALGVRRSHHHQIHGHPQWQRPQGSTQRPCRLLPFLWCERGLGHHHQHIEIGIRPGIPPRPGAKQQQQPRARRRSRGQGLPSLQGRASLRPTALIPLRRSPQNWCHQRLAPVRRSLVSRSDSTS